MEGLLHRIAGVLLFYVSVASAYIHCGFQTCSGSGAYCCHLDDGTIGCCWEIYVYELWWFWLIWVMVFFLILGCALACWRRRRAQYRYVVMANSEYPSYGTVVSTSTANTTYNSQRGYVPPYSASPAVYPNAPVAPPSYDAAQATKPPAYNS